MDSQGMKNAKKILEKLGWAEGSGLGLNKDGITEAIKPSKKFDLSGIGHKNFNDFQWWDHAFNKAAQAFDIKVTDDQGVIVEKTEAIGKIKTKKGSSNLDQNNLAYGVFHKTGTLHNGIVESTESTFKLKEETDYSLKLSDEELFKLCNGLTAHKGARHGLTASGKLARIAKQEAAMLASMNKKKSVEINSNEKIEQTTCIANEIVSVPHSDDMITSNERSTKSKKKKKSRKEIDCATDEMNSHADIQDAPETSFLISKKEEKRKKKKEAKNRENQTELLVPEPVEEPIEEPRKKRKKVKTIDNEAEQPLLEESIQQTCDEPKKKKKKKNRDKFDC
ncbi:hypothetical protein DAPPUDRAFT_201747 [Daphnia pulex]|uniref:G patch domain-containing protein 4 n=1 Tax=Daphnia pulex TaxID=6669 RepID=E9HA51_DAPPU|nr:hypothetical protein DAPPUDRAFT_201747 [Daphnia pulex]|eukprot:EFX71369.1 hypothetical protein DAPPUDRAFT_201747 [Daphnia pulex]